MKADEPTRLVRSCEELGIAVDPALAQRLISYLDLLYFWNPSAGLTTVYRRDAVRLHLVDSLLFAADLTDAHRVGDFGSGAGLPGIPLALVLTDAHFTLVESKRRKCSFLREAVRELALPNCAVVEADAATVEAEAFGFDAVVSRAFMPPLQWIPFAAERVADRGRVLVAAGRETQSSEIHEAAAAAGLVVSSERRFVLPGGTERRRVFRLDRS